MKRKFFSIFFIATLCLTYNVWAVTVNSQVVLERTYGQNPEAQSLMLDKDISIEALRASKAQYDTFLSGQLYYEKDKSERSVPVMGTNTSTTNYNFGIRQLIPSGTELTAGFYNTRATSDSAFSAAAALYDSRFYFSLKQPLLLNMFGYQNRKNVTLAKQGIKTTQTALQASLQGLAYKNLSSYWTWYLYKKLESISHNALAAAQRLHRTNRQKMDIGLIEETDIYAFAANVDIKKAELLDVKSKGAMSESQLRVAIALPDAKLLLGKQTLSFGKMPSTGIMIDQAKDSNPEFLTHKNTLKAQNIIVAMKKNARLPQIDLTTSLTLNGIDPTYAAAFTDISNGNPIWTGGFEVTYPLQNRQARANYNKEKFIQAQALLSLKNMKNKIIATIKNGYEKYQTSKSRMYVVATAVQHQKLKWEGEVKKYDQGRSDPDVVIRYQNDYLDTQKLYAQAVFDYAMARLELDSIRGLLKP
ncbi:TolC family protein [bacterium]|nr:TolC family protein [bacterium]